MREFTFGHVRQLDAVASRFLLALAAVTGLVKPSDAQPKGSQLRGFAFVDVDDTVIEVHGHAKQGAGFGYTKVRGLNALLATATTPDAAPVIVAQRLRRGGVFAHPGAGSVWSLTRSPPPGGCSSAAHTGAGADGLGVMPTSA